jgi:hypothetical protein
LLLLLTSQVNASANLSFKYISWYLRSSCAALRIAAASVTIQPLQKSAGGSIAPEPGDVTFLFCLIYCFASNGSCEL